MPSLLRFWKNSEGEDAEPTVVPKLPWEVKGTGEGQKEGMVPEINCLLSEFVYIWPRLKALIFSLEGKTLSIQTSNSSPLGRQTSSYPLTSGRERQRITPILTGAEVSYFLFLLYHGKIFHMYLQCIMDS